MESAITTYWSGHSNCSCPLDLCCLWLCWSPSIASWPRLGPSLGAGALLLRHLLIHDLFERVFVVVIRSVCLHFVARLIYNLKFIFITL
jgi:hypothetical protein